MNPATIDLARRLQGGDRSALEPLLEEVQRGIFQYTWLMCGQREDAEEVAQDTLLQVSQKWGQLADPARVKPWVFRIARNVCLMKRRKSVFAPVAELPADDLPLSSRDPSPEDLVALRELSEDLSRVLREVPEALRVVLLLRDREGLSTADTAELLEISEDAVKQRLHRGRLAFRTAWRERQATGPLTAQSPRE